MTCPECGTPIADGTRFCPNCGAKQATSATAEVRKTVTILFADVTGSTALGEQLDPESLRALMTRYFREMTVIIERHGGRVEKFIGDAVMAVFGIPTLHEDDALRAVRAAAEIKERLAVLNTELEAERGLRITFRTGVNTGEVVAGDVTADQTLVTGDTVNTAARLEQAATPGEILLGESTYRLTRDAVAVEAVEPIIAKGKAQPVSAYRLISVVPGGEGHQRRLDSPLAGRADELALLRDRFQRVVTDGSPQLVTVLGHAGIGKSRLVAELLASVSDQAAVLKGRCLPYGDGITYWPLREIVFAAADIGEGDSGDEAKAKLLELLAGAPDAELLARRVGTALGLEAEAAPQEEIFWAVRRLLEHLAASWPLVTVWEDIHWAEPTLLDLLEYLLDMATDVPVLFLCPARPELLEARPGWGGTRQNSSTLHLEALSDDAAASLLDSLPGASALPPGLRSRIQTAAEGNPLYLEEMLGMLIDDGHLVQDEGHWVARDDLEAVQVPPSVRALLATRIDALPAVEQAVAKRASVAGRTFEAAAVREMTPEFAADVGRSLLGLVRKELVRPERSEVGPGDAFKFRHLLIRDAAYEALSKSERASLHERFADWLARVSGDRIEEYEEILGYHLEQAAGYRRELGQTSDAERLGSAAGEYFLTAGTRADRRGDNTAVIPLMRKASELLQGAARNDALLVLATALSGAGEYGESRAILERVRDAAGEAGDRVMERRATIRWSVIVIGEPEPGDAVIRAGLREAIDDLGPDGPDVELANAWLGIGLIAVDRSEEWTAFERSLDFARRGGDLRTASAAVGNLASALQVGPTPVAEALRTVEGFEADFAGNRRAFAVLKVAKAGLIAMLGQFDEARSLLKEAVDICGDLGLTSWQVLIRGEQAELELLAGNLPGAFEALRPTDELDEDIGPMRQWHQAVKVRVLAASGRSSEAVELADNFLDANAEALPDTDPKVHMGRASALRAMGALADARTDIERAIQLLTQYEALPHLGLALIERAEINRDAGDEDWRADLDRARDAFERKGHLVGLGLVQSFLDRE